jgi:murein DD-endopeptidase MepM/ murein hydrolase activator NlpD
VLQRSRTRAGSRSAHRALIPSAGARLPQVYRVTHTRDPKRIRLGDPGEVGRSSKLKWFLSTCAAAAIGVGAIGLVLLGATDPADTVRVVSQDAQRSVWQRIWDLDKLKPTFTPTRRTAGHIQAAGGKGDRLETAAGGMITRHIVHDSVRQRRGNREFIQIKSYARIVARLSTLPPGAESGIPPFNPFKLYANPEPIAETEMAKGDAGSENNSEVSVRIVELLGGFLPEEDGQEIGNDEATNLVLRSGISTDTTAMRQGIQADSAAATDSEPSSETPETRKVASDPIPPNTTIIVRTGSETDDSVEGRETRIVRVSPGATLVSILRDVGAEVWQARAIVDMANTTFPVAELKPGHEVRLTVDPSPTNDKKVVPVRVSLYAEAHRHLVTVMRNTAGEYVLANTPSEAELVSSDNSGESAGSSLYASLYRAALSQGISTDVIEQILRINAYDVDFKRRVRPGDSFELFFDLRDGDKQADGELGELLYTSLTVGGETKTFHRFRAADGTVEFYDKDGNNSKRFLNLKPVRSEAARRTDGFGMRPHPLYRIMRMHTGIDWAAPPGTPIMAAGSGVIEESGRKGGYGNYVRIRHANGYKSTYGHMQSLARGVVQDARVRQGQIIGFVGSTGSSTGPHLHFEILVNNNFVDPARLQVPRQRRLVGKDRPLFDKEHVRLMDLLHRTPVSTRVYTDKQEEVGRREGNPISTSSIVTDIRK